MGTRLVTAFGSVLFAAVASAGTINVPADQATIAAVESQSGGLMLMVK